MVRSSYRNQVELCQQFTWFRFKANKENGDMKRRQRQQKELFYLYLIIYTTNFTHAWTSFPTFFYIVFKWKKHCYYFQFLTLIWINLQSPCYIYLQKLKKKTLPQGKKLLLSKKNPYIIINSSCWFDVNIEFGKALLYWVEKIWRSPTTFISDLGSS